MSDITKECTKEELLEQLYWEFDTVRNSKQMDERSIFKGKMRFFRDYDIDDVPNVSVSVDSDIFARIHQALIEAKENSTELMNNHINDNGMDTKKDRFIADMYENEVREISCLLNYMSNHEGLV